jgi:hypothetical protein
MLPWNPSTCVRRARVKSLLRPADHFDVGLPSTATVLRANCNMALLLTGSGALAAHDLVGSVRSRPAMSQAVLTKEYNPFPASFYINRSAVRLGVEQREGRSSDNWACGRMKASRNTGFYWPRGCGDRIRASARTADAGESVESPGRSCGGGPDLDGTSRDKDPQTPGRLLRIPCAAGAPRIKGQYRLMGFDASCCDARLRATCNITFLVSEAVHSHDFVAFGSLLACHRRRPDHRSPSGPPGISCPPLGVEQREGRSGVTGHPGG